MNTPVKHTNPQMTLNKLPAYFLLAVIALVFYFLLQVISPFIEVLLISAVVATVTYPIYKKLLTFFKGRKRAAAVVTCLLVMFLVIVPFTLFLLVLFRQTIDLYQIVNNFVTNVDFNTLFAWSKGNFLYDISGPYSESIASLVQENIVALKSGVTDAAASLSTFAATQSAKLLASIGVTLFNFLLMFFTMYFFYKDGDTLLKRIMLISPIPLKYEKEIASRFGDISRATLFGTFLTAICQGLVAWVGFMIAGVPSAFFWATAVSIFSLVPVVGTSMIWMPMGLFLLISGNIFGGLFVLGWGLLLVSTVDNLLRIIFIGATANLNPLLTFLAVFGGIIAFGLSGVIFGPMLVVMFLTLLHIYEREYAELLEDHQVLKENGAKLDEPMGVEQFKKVEIVDKLLAKGSEKLANFKKGKHK
ncbi:MAG: AI-2E family transporter [Candidatus Altimarinota bacterium]